MMTTTANNWAMLCLSPAKGGLEMLAVDAVKNIENFYFAIVLENSWIAKELQQNNTVVFHQQKPSKLPLASAYKIAVWIINNKIDLLHIHWTKDLLIAVLIKKILANKGYPIKLVVSRHMSLSRPKKDLYHRWLYTAVDTYISVCNFVHNQAKQRLPINIDRLHQVYPGVTAGEQATRLPFDINNEILNITVLGRLEPNKGQYLILKALAAINNKNIHCHFVGHVMDEHYLNELGTLAQDSGVSEQVTFHGFIDNPARYLSHFDALVLTTHCETFGLVLIEAMRAGTMVIGSNCGGVLEIIEHKKTGLLFESKNAIDLAKQLQWLLDNPNPVKHLCLAGERKAKQLFDKEKNYRQLKHVLDNII
jgi:glycosyltransferase involved in cell wall biosynthesis